jgi:hypothetical protein
MKTVSACQANHEFSALLSRAERVLSPYRQPAVTGEREKAIQHAINLMATGLSWGDILPRPTRDEMHDRE